MPPSLRSSRFLHCCVLIVDGGLMLALGAGDAASDEGSGSAALRFPVHQELQLARGSVAAG